jgi:hypothetical protein
VVGQDWITSGGHHGFWNAFALDLRALDDNYAQERNPTTIGTPNCMTR